MTSPKPPLSPSDSIVPEIGSSVVTGCVGMVWHSAKEGAEKFVERLLDCNFTILSNMEDQILRDQIRRGSVPPFVISAFAVQPQTLWCPGSRIVLSCGRVWKGAGCNSSPFRGIACPRWGSTELSVLFVGWVFFLFVSFIDYLNV